MTIKPSDKGGNVVIVDRVNYIAMDQQIIQDGSIYEVLRGDPTKKYLVELKSLLDDALTASLILKDKFNFVYVKNQKIATFYALPKVHKKHFDWETHCFR
ncbi:Hypothetical predicted protein [Pelobates cultripes]|uniref:Uncharacterized protein n=1 Tax=Pelobates cultripes TaxID=61616 RepID=A0AAD1TL48_PELCU|nr:Hypothetical predicted protein [Pelobates cultripes]CAH2329721.1 Hypothetical predicted protein [Pelobates cultripes]